MLWNRATANVQLCIVCAMYNVQMAALIVNWIGMRQNNNRTQFIFNWFKFLSYLMHSWLWRQRDTLTYLNISTNIGFWYRLFTRIDIKFCILISPKGETWFTCAHVAHTNIYIINAFYSCSFGTNKTRNGSSQPQRINIRWTIELN